MSSISFLIVVSVLSMTESMASPDPRCNLGFLLPDRIKECLDAMEGNTNINGENIKEDNEDKQMVEGDKIKEDDY